MHVYIFRLDAKPFCDGHIPCAHNTGAWREGLLTLGLYVACATINEISRLPRLSRVPSISTVPGMTAMMVGWALGDTLVEWRQELLSAYPDALCVVELGDCTGSSILAATVLTVLGGLLVAALLPLSRSTECGSGAIVDRIEDWIETFFRLLSKSIATSLMVLWTTVLTEFELLGIDRSIAAAGARRLEEGEAALVELEPSGGGGDVAARLQRISLVHTHIFWAAAITWAGSLIATQAEKLEARMQWTAEGGVGGERQAAFASRMAHEVRGEVAGMRLINGLARRCSASRW